MVEREFYLGNAPKEAPENRGWIVGKFPDHVFGERFTEDVEIKYGVHKQGEEREKWSYSKTATSLTMVVSGKMQLDFPSQSIVLAEKGDYVVWGPNIPHKWKVLEDVEIITVRWPSKPEDNVQVSPNSIIKA